jgi:hypothetical protein
MATVSDLEKEEIDKLFAKAMALQPKGKAYWSYIYKLQSLGNRYTFSIAKELCLSKKKSNQLAGINVLCQLFTTSNPGKENSYKRIYRRESINVIRTFVNNRDEDILCATIYGLAHLHANNINQLVGRYSTHKNPEIRFAVAFALARDQSNAAINKLIELTKDKDPDVRDWATFGLGNIGEKDTPVIREALFQRVGDRDKDTHYEAIIGLAKRKDARIIGVIQKEIESKQPWGYIFEAITEYPMRQYLPALKKHWNKASKKERNEEFWYSLLRDAIKACDEAGI